jgi:hypothetical protein
MPIASSKNTAPQLEYWVSGPHSWIGETLCTIAILALEFFLIVERSGDGTPFIRMKASAVIQPLVKQQKISREGILSREDRESIRQSWASLVILKNGRKGAPNARS